MDINQIASIAMPIILGGIVYLAKKLIVPIGDTVIDYLKEKKATLGINKQLADHQNEVTTAKEIWNIVEEKYRITEKVEDLLVSKSQMFDKLLLQKIPYLTQDNIDDLRQAIAGEFNKGKQAIITDESLKQAQIELQNTNSQLVNQNNDLATQNQVLQNQVVDLNNKLNAINNALSNVGQQANVVTTPAYVESISNTSSVYNEIQKTAQDIQAINVVQQ
jgi:predicted glycoside hydrolase/deacetylase ChbG (UPF0249 family)